MSRKQINVRLSDEENEFLEQLSREHNKPKSEIVRQAFQSELAKIDAKKNKSLSDKEREMMLENIGVIMTFMSRTNRNMLLMGNNINQIAKQLNMGHRDVSFDRLDEFIKYMDNLADQLPYVSKELNRIWQSLV